MDKHTLIKGLGEELIATSQLAYRRYTFCKRQGWAEYARTYNELITSRTAIESAASASTTEKQCSLFKS